MSDYGEVLPLFRGSTRLFADRPHLLLHLRLERVQLLLQLCLHLVIAGRFQLASERFHRLRRIAGFAEGERRAEFARHLRPDPAAAEVFRAFLDSPHRVIIEFTPDYTLSFDGALMWARSPGVNG